jgi:hypothetical protein
MVNGEGTRQFAALPMSHWLRSSAFGLRNFPMKGPLFKQSESQLK